MVLASLVIWDIVEVYGNNHNGVSTSSLEPHFQKNNFVLKMKMSVRVKAEAYSGRGFGGQTTLFGKFFSIC